MKVVHTPSVWPVTGFFTQAQIEDAKEVVWNWHCRIKKLDALVEDPDLIRSTKALCLRMQQENVLESFWKSVVDLTTLDVIFSAFQHQN